MRNLLAFLRLIPGAQVRRGDADTMLVDVTTDSRLVQPGWAFVAIRGTRFDGHTAIDAVVRSGAVVVITEEREGIESLVPADDEFKHVTLVTVPDPRYAFAIITNALMENPSRGMRFVGVTGTNGKTTVATVLEQVYTAAGREAAFVGTTGIRYNGSATATGYTTPHVRELGQAFVDMKTKRVDTVCMEVSSHALDQHRVHGIAFHGALFTNLTHDHLDYHGSMEAYAAAKQRLFTSLSLDAIAVVNADDPAHATMLQHCKARRQIRVGTADDASVQIDDVQVNAHGCSYVLSLPPTKRGAPPHDLHISTSLIGRFNVMNTALCAVMALQDGIAESVVVEALRTVHGPAGRMERYPLATGATAVVDYAHTPDALTNALAVLRELVPEGGKLFVVFGCGGDRDAAKRPIMGGIAAKLADRTWITNDNPRGESPETIAEQILEGIPAGTRKKKKVVQVVLDRREAIAQALKAAGPHDVVLVAGKGHETVQIVGTESLPFSDLAEVAAWNGTKRGNSYI